jgi:hypothetical protein
MIALLERQGGKHDSASASTGVPPRSMNSLTSSIRPQRHAQPRAWTEKMKQRDVLAELRKREPRPS